MGDILFNDLLVLALVHEVNVVNLKNYIKCNKRA